MTQSHLFAPKPVVLPDVRLIHGDCLEEMPKLEAGSVAMVFADLPYAATAAKWDVLIDLERMWSSLRMVCRHNAQCVFTANMRLATSLIASNPKCFRHDLVWHKKGRPSGYLQASKQPLRVHEHVLVFSLGAHPTYTPQKTEGKPHDRHKYVVSNSGGESFPVAVQRVKPNLGTRHPQSVLAMDRITGAQMHPTQKPVALMTWLLKTYTNEGDLVLDPTAGSGTTAVAALRTGRRAICIEKSEQYYKVMCERVEKEKMRLRNEH